MKMSLFVKPFFLIHVVYVELQRHLNRGNLCQSINKPKYYFLLQSFVNLRNLDEIK